MPRGRRSGDRPLKRRREVAEFVSRLYEASGCATQVEFAGRAGVIPGSLSDWIGGRNVPDGWNLLQLIKASGAIEGMFEQSILNLVRLSQKDPEVVPVLAEVADGLQAAADELEEIVRLLRVAVDRAPSPAPPEDATS